MEMKNDSAKFIAFEGMDGSGKSTQIDLLARRMKENNHPVYQTFQPTDSPIGRLIRDVLAQRMAADHRTIAGLFVADRPHHPPEPTPAEQDQTRPPPNAVIDRYHPSATPNHGTHVE